MITPFFRSVVLDVDSTLSGVEGIDWLAARRGADVAARIAQLTERAMSGEITLDQIYGQRLVLVQPSVADVEALSRAYVAALAPGAAEALRLWHEAGVRVTLVSGGLRHAISPLASSLGVGDDDLHAVAVYWDADGSYTGFDTGSPLTTHQGKARIVADLGLPGPVLAVGDGATDLAMKPVVEKFVAFTGFVRRDAVVSNADHVAAAFYELTEIVLP
jgi:phosphoserine phosphatase